MGFIGRNLNWLSKKAFSPSLFIVLSSVFWTILALRLLLPGIYIEGHVGPGLNRFASTISVWRTVPISQHGFLPFFEPEDFSASRSYTNFSQGFMLISCFWVFLAHKILGMSVTFSQRLVFFPIQLCYTALLASLVWSSTAKFFGMPQRTLIIFLALGCALTCPLIWVSMISYPPDNMHVYASLAFLALAILDARNLLHWRIALWPLALLALLVPLYLPCALLVLLLCQEESRDRREIVALTVVLALAALSLFGPRLTFHLLGFEHDLASSPLYRSGLSGESTYFSSHLQAIIYPTGQRLWNILHLPAIIVALLACSAIGEKEKTPGESAGGVRFFRFTAISISPYLFIVALFPQYVSIHPYVTDNLLAVACSASLLFFFLEVNFQNRWPREVASCFALLLILCSLALIVNNLNDIARGARQARITFAGKMG